MKKLFYIGALSALLLTACGDEVQESNQQSTTEKEQIDQVEQPTTTTWNEEINTLATNADSASDKFYSLEKYMMNYEVSADELELFQKEIIEDYKSDTYISELDNHNRMLTNIFKSFIVEKNTEGAVKDFAFDYHQNLKYTYRGADTVDSESVKSNEKQMDEALNSVQ